jgi:hypothetical protein
MPPGMDPVFSWIESLALSVWLRESPSIWAFPFVLILHTVGLAFLVGANVALDVRVLGVARGVPLRTLERFGVVMWTGFWINAVSGVLLLLAYPTKAFTNPLFYVKLVLIGVGLGIAAKLRARLRALPVPEAHVLPPRLQALAVLSLVCWAAGITAGRLLAYTYSRLTVDLVG